MLITPTTIYSGRTIVNSMVSTIQRKSDTFFDDCLSSLNEIKMTTFVVVSFHPTETNLNESATHVSRVNYAIRT